MDNITYCRFCGRELKTTDNKHVKFCSDECKESYENSEQTNTCGRCGCRDEVETYKVGEDLVNLCPKCLDKFANTVSNVTTEFTGLHHFELAAKHIIMGLNDMGFETDEANFKDTPKRFARAYSEIFSGCKDTEEQVKAILSTSFPSMGSENMVIAKDIVCFSACPHHLLPVEYHVCVGYIPSKDGDVLGISKLARLVTVLAKRPALQETFTQEICDYLDTIGGEGSIAFVEGQHMCMRMRGAKAVNTTITTTSVSGYFKEDMSVKQEFLSNISDRLKFR